MKQNWKFTRRWFPVVPTAFVLALSACAPVSPPVPGVDAQNPPAAEVAPSVSDTGAAPDNRGMVGIPNAQDVRVAGTALLDYDFTNLNGDVSGEIEDLIIDLTSGRILYATLEYGGFLEIGDKEIAVPLNALTWGENGQLVLAFPEETLEQLPDLGANWPDVTNNTWDDSINQFWGGLGYDPGFSLDEARNNIVRASTLIGYPVGDVGVGTGTVQNMIVDLGQSRVDYLLLDYEYSLFSEELVAVPVSALDVTEFGNELRLNANVDQATLEGAPRVVPTMLGTEPLDMPFADTYNPYWQARGLWRDEQVLGGTGEAAGSNTERGVADSMNGVMVGVENAQELMVTASALLGYDFENIDGQVSGNIQDMIVDVATGRILYMTIEYGGFLEIGDTELAMPLNAFVWGANNRLLLNFPEESLQNFPDLGTGWEMDNPAWDDEVAAFWRNIGIDPGYDATEVSNTVRRASTLLSYSIADAGVGNGSLEDMVVDLGEGRVRYLLLDDYGNVTTADDLIAVPISAFDAASFGEEFVFDRAVTGDMLQSAPRFDRTLLGNDPLDLTLSEEFGRYWEEQGIALEDSLQ